MERGLETLKGGKPQPINFCRPKMCLLAAYEDTIRAMTSSLIVSSYAAIRHIFGPQKLIGCGLPPFSAFRPCSIAYLCHLRPDAA